MKFKRLFEDATDEYSTGPASPLFIRGSYAEPWRIIVLANYDTIFSLGSFAHHLTRVIVGGMADVVEKLNFELIELLIEIQSSEKAAMRRV